MKFQFNVKVNDQDYVDYNTFWMIRSPYGKKQIKTFRITIAVIFAIFISISLFSGGFSIESIIGIIPMLIVLSLTQIFLTRFFSWSVKGTVKNLKKSGIYQYLDCIYTTEDDAKEEKHQSSKVYDMALEHLNGTKENTVVFEDVVETFKKQGKDLKGRVPDGYIDKDNVRCCVKEYDNFFDNIKKYDYLLFDYNLIKKDITKVIKCETKYTNKWIF